MTVLPSTPYIFSLSQRKFDIQIAKIAKTLTQETVGAMPNIGFVNKLRFKTGNFFFSFLASAAKEKPGSEGLQKGGLIKAWAIS